MCNPTPKARWEVEVGEITQEPAGLEYSIKQQKQEGPCLNKVEGNNQLL